MAEVTITNPSGQQTHIDDLTEHAGFSSEEAEALARSWDVDRYKQPGEPLSQARYAVHFETDDPLDAIANAVMLVAGILGVPRDRLVATAAPLRIAEALADLCLTPTENEESHPCFW